MSNEQKHALLMLLAASEAHLRAPTIRNEKTLRAAIDDAKRALQPEPAEA